MSLKDYYKTLGIPSTATELQVKKSFRSLALRFHPDKNPGDVTAEATFREIQEAYEVLSDVKKREEYNYKRWYARSMHQPFTAPPLTATAILAECTRLANYLRSVSSFRIEYDGLSYHIRQLLTDKNIGILLQQADDNLRGSVLSKLLPAAAVLPHRYIEPIAALFLQLAGDNAPMIEQVNNFTREQDEKQRWQRLRPLLVLAVTLLLCWIIYTVSR